MTNAYLYDWAGYNAALFSVINTLHWPVLDGLAWLLSHLIDFQLAWLYPLVLAMAVNGKNNWEGISGSIGRGRERWAMWSRFTVSLMLATAVVAALKAGFDFPRPVDSLGAGVVQVVGIPQHGHSFPSGHAALAGLFVVCFWPAAAIKGRLVLLMLLPLMMLARIVVGAHYPADVLAGAVVGLGIPLMVSPQRALAILSRVFTGWPAGRPVEPRAP